LTRELRPEAMDDPALPAGRHRHALRGLSRLNALSGSTRILWPAIAKLARSQGRALRILDLASGAGDVPLGLWRRARRARLEMEIHGLDVSPRAVNFAREQAKRLGAAVRFEELDVLADPLPADYDVLISSLFLHHVSEDDAVLLLNKMRHATRHAVLINDLLRSAGGLALAHVASRLFTSSDVVHLDAPQSVRASFTAPELLALARRAEMDGARVSQHWPQRLLLTWNAT
jgi:SAM-dependent methyltransferase